MSQSGFQSFSGKICPDCSKSSFVLEGSILNNVESGISIQIGTYVCPNCGLKIKHLQHNEAARIHISDAVKIEEVVVSGGH
jgi:ribosomal protein S27AE